MTDNMTPTNNERDAVEKLAKLIYMQWALSPNYVQWVEGGNSHNQDKARSIAREFMKDYQSPISQNEQQEAVAWMIWWDGDKWLFTGDKEDFDVATKNKFPITPLYTSPPKQAIPEDVIKDAERYNWLKQNYHGFEMFRHSTIPYVTLDREVDKAMLNSAPTNTEVGE